MGFGGNPTDGEIGARCDSSDDCRAELVCVPSTQDLGDTLGGPPHGWCTLPCDQANMDADCAALSVVATCIRFNNATPDDMTDDSSFCLETCLLGTPPDAIENKCHQRAELACWPATLDIGFCAPSCGSDADCGDRFCDLSTGTCMDQAPAGDPIGASCDPTDDGCAGFCLQFTEDAAGSTCSGACTFGTVGCGDDPTSTDPTQFICLPDVNSLGGGDLGLCLEACDCNEQCTNPGNICRPVPDPGLAEFYGRAGYCAPPLPPMPGAPAPGPATDAGADAGADAGVSSDPSVSGIVTCP
jgi:hypothetical protein